MGLNRTSYTGGGELVILGILGENTEYWVDSTRVNHLLHLQFTSIATTHRGLSDSIEVWVMAGSTPPIQKLTENIARRQNKKNFPGFQESQG